MDHIVRCLFVLGTVSLNHACPKYCVCQNLSESLGTLCPSKGILFVPPDIDRRTVELRLGGNYILRITQQDFANMSNLVDLTLSRNTISYIQPFSFADLEALNSLHLDNNRLMALGPDDLQGLVNLQHLIMNNNQLGNIHGRAFEDAAPVLEDLDLSYNNLVSLPWDSVRRMVNLHQLSLDHNLLDFIPEGIFTDLERLSRLDLTSNRLQKLPPDPIFARTQDFVVPTTSYEPQLSLNLGGNPLHCNCELLWLRRLRRTDDLETCASPLSLKGRYFWNVKEEEFVCQPPLIAQRTQRILVLEGQTATLRCEAVGDPKPTIHWISPDDSPIRNSSRNLVHSNGTLSIVITTIKDDGTFTCIAANVAGESTASADVSVVQLPHLSNGSGQMPQPNSGPLNITGPARVSNGGTSVIQREEAVSVSEVTTVSALVKWTLSKSAPKVKMYQLQYNSSEDDGVLIYRMIPASSQTFLLTNLVSGTRYDLCVLAAWDDLATTLTATSLVGCTDLYTQDDYYKCQSLSGHPLGGAVMLVIGGFLLGGFLLCTAHCVILLVCFNGTYGETALGRLMNFFDKLSQGTGGQLRPNELPISTQLEPVVKRKMSLRDRFERNSPPSSVSPSSSSSGSLVRGSYSPKRTLLKLWGTAPSKPPESNLDHRLGAFTAIERPSAQECDSQLSTGLSVSTDIPQSGRELLLAQTLDSGLRRLLMLPLDSRMKRSRSTDVRDATVGSAAPLGNTTNRMGGIWTKRSLSVNGMLLQCEETEDGRSSQANLDNSDWVMESTV